MKKKSKTEHAYNRRLEVGQYIMVILNSQLYLFKIMTVYANYGEIIILLTYLLGGFDFRTGTANCSLRRYRKKKQTKILILYIS